MGNLIAVIGGTRIDRYLCNFAEYFSTNWFWVEKSRIFKASTIWQKEDENRDEDNQSTLYLLEDQWLPPQHYALASPPGGAPRHRPTFRGGPPADWTGLCARNLGLTMCRPPGVTNWLLLFFFYSKGGWLVLESVAPLRGSAKTPDCFGPLWLLKFDWTLGMLTPPLGWFLF